MHIPKLASALLFAATIVGLTGCSNGSSSGTQAPPPLMSPFNVAGNYSGSSTDSVLGRGTLNANIVQAGKSLAGLWTFTYPNTPNPATSFTGTINGAMLELRITSSSFSPCSYSITGTVSGKHIFGSYTSSNCPNSGNFSITRP